MIGKSVIALLVFLLMLVSVSEIQKTEPQKAFAENNIESNYNFQPNLFAKFGTEYLLMQQQFPFFDPFYNLINDQSQKLVELLLPSAEATTFGYTTGTLKTITSSATGGTACSALASSSDASGEIGITVAFSVTPCHRTSAEWNISSIPDGAIITNTVLRYDITTITNPRNCDFNSMENQPSTSSDQVVHDDIADGTTFVSSNSGCTTVSNDKILDLGTSADTDLQNNLSSDWWGVGIKYNNEVKDGFGRQPVTFANVELQVTYTLRTYPDPVVYLDFDTGNIQGSIDQEMKNLGTEGNTHNGILKTGSGGTNTTYSVAGATLTTGILGTALFQNGAGGLSVEVGTTSDLTFLHLDGSPDGANKTSINFWIKDLGSTGVFGATHRLILTSGTPLGSDSGMSIHLTTSDSPRRFRITTEVLGDSPTERKFGVATKFTSTTVPPTGSGWHMITLIEDKRNATSTVQLCLDTVCDPEGRTNAWSGLGTETSQYPLTIGKEDCAGGICESAIFDMDEFAIWKDYQLTSTEMQFLYNSGSGNRVLEVESFPPDAITDLQGHIENETSLFSTGQTTERDVGLFPAMVVQIVRPSGFTTPTLIDSLKWDSAEASPSPPVGSEGIVHGVIIGDRTGDLHSGSLTSNIYFIENSTNSYSTTAIGSLLTFNFSGNTIVDSDDDKVGVGIYVSDNPVRIRMGYGSGGLPTFAPNFPIIGERAVSNAWTCFSDTSTFKAISCTDSVGDHMADFNILGGNGRAILNWTAPADNGSPITGYNIQRTNASQIQLFDEADSGDNSVLANIVKTNIGSDVTPTGFIGQRVTFPNDVILTSMTIALGDGFTNPFPFTSAPTTAVLHGVVVQGGNGSSTVTRIANSTNVTDNPSAIAFYASAGFVAMTNLEVYGFNNTRLEGGVEYIIGLEVVSSDKAWATATDTNDASGHPNSGLGVLTQKHSATGNVWIDTAGMEYNFNLSGFNYTNEVASTGTTSTVYTSNANFPSTDSKINAYSYLVSAINNDGTAPASNFVEVSPDRSASFDTWQYIELDDRGFFYPQCEFSITPTSPFSFNMSAVEGAIGTCYLFKSFDSSLIDGSDIRVDFRQRGSTLPAILVLDGSYDKDSPTDFVKSRGITSKGGAELNRTSIYAFPLAVHNAFCDPDGFSTSSQECSVTIPASQINYAGSTQNKITVFFANIGSASSGHKALDVRYIAISNVGSWNYTNPRLIKTVNQGIETGGESVFQAKEDDRGTVFSNSVVNGTVEIFPIPQNLSVSQNLRKIAELNWDNEPDADSFQILRKTGNGNFVALVTTRDSDYRDTTLAYNQNYTYKVRSQVGVSYSDNSTTVLFGLINPISNFNVNQINNTSVGLTWNSASTADPNTPLTSILIQRKNSEYISDNYEDRFAFENYTDAFTYYFDHGSGGGQGTLSCPNFDARTGQLTGIINCVDLKVSNQTGQVLSGGGTKSLVFNGTTRRNSVDEHFQSIAMFNITKNIDEFAFDYKGVDSWAGGTETSNGDTQGWGIVYNYYNGTEKVYTDELIQRARCSDFGASNDYYVRNGNFCNAVDHTTLTTAPPYKINKFGQIDSTQLNVAVATNIARGVQTNVGGNVTSIFTSNFGTASDFNTYVRDWELHIGSFAQVSQTGFTFPDIRAHTGHAMIIDNLIFQYHNNSVVPFSNWSNVTSLTPSATSYTVTGLTSSTDYNFRIVPIANPIGEFVYATNTTLGVFNETLSDFTAVVDSTTLKSPPFQITTLIGSTVSNTCELTWNAPSDGNSPINGYKILRQATGEGSFSVLVANTTTTITTYTNIGLVNNIVYQYDVRALNSFGDSVTSNIVDCQPIVGGVPNEPTNLDADEESNGDVTLIWNEPATGDPTGYRVERKVGQGSFIILTNNTGTPSLIYLDGTSNPATEYTYRVAGWNAFGLDGYSNEATINTSNPPQAPILSAVQNVNKIDLSWVAPFSDNPINGYKIERRVNGGGFSVLVANTTSTGLTYFDFAVTKPNTYGYRVSALSSAGQGSLSNIVDVIFGSHVIVQVREQDGTFFNGGGTVKISNSTYNAQTSLDSNSNAIFDNYPVANFNYTFKDNTNFILNKTFNFPFPSGNNTSTFTIRALVFDVDCPANGAGTDVRIKVNYTNVKNIFSFPSTPVCDSSDQVSWSTRWIGASTVDSSKMVADFISTLFMANARTFLASSGVIPTTYSSSQNAILSDPFEVNSSDTTINFNLFMGRAPASGGGGSSGSGGTTKPVESGQSAIPATKIIIKNQLGGLSILSRTHPFAKAGDVIQGTVTVQWEGTSPLTVTGINEKEFSEYINFDVTPIPIKQKTVGIGEFAKSEGEIPYTITLPADICDPEMGITQNCIDAKLLDFPLEFEFEFLEARYEASTDVFVDLSPIPFDIVQFQIILLGVALLGSALAGNAIRKRLKPKVKAESRRKKKFKKKFDSS